MYNHPKPVELEDLPHGSGDYTDGVETVERGDKVPVVVLSCVDEDDEWPVEDSHHQLDHNQRHSIEEVESCPMHLELQTTHRRRRYI